MIKELLNICYKFFNRFITADELISLLENIDKNNSSKEEASDFNQLVNDIKKIVDENPNMEDEFVKEKKKKIKKMIDKLSSIEKKADFVNKPLANLKKEYEKETDSHERWIKVFNTINDNAYFNKCFDSLSDYELLEFIAHYICAPFPPTLNQDEFNRLVTEGIKHDKREWLWRLAFNYDKRNINFDLIVDYFIKVKDGYYLSELISAVGDSLDIDLLVDKLSDKEIIKYLVDDRNIIKNHVSEDNFNKLIEKL